MIKVQMLWAVTGKTAAEIINLRSNPTKKNMGLTSFKGNIVRKNDVTIAKNHLKKEEIEELNIIVTMYLDYAENQAKKRKTISMSEWSKKLDAFLEFNEKDILTHSGKLEMSVAKKLATEKFEIFDLKRKKEDAFIANQDDIKELEMLEKEIIMTIPISD